MEMRKLKLQENELEALSSQISKFKDKIETIDIQIVVLNSNKQKMIENDLLQKRLN